MQISLFSSIFLFFLFGVIPGFYLLQLLLSIVGYLFLVLLLLVLASPQSENLKTIHFWHIHILHCFGRQIRIDLTYHCNYHQQNVGKRTPEVCPINVVAFLLRHVHFLAFWAINFDSGGSNLLTHPYRQSGLPIAQNSRANSECCFIELLLHYC